MMRDKLQQPTPAVDQPSVREIPAFFAATAIALVLASGFALLACFGGLLFSGVSAFFIVLVTVGVCAVVTSVTALVFRRKQKHFRWRTLFIEVSVLALVGICIFSWVDTRQHLQIHLKPAPVPGGLRVHHGRSTLFSSYAHFTGPPTAIASLLKLKGLVEVSAAAPDTSDYTAFGSRENSKMPWSWWQPATMSNPRFFFRLHQGAAQGWSEGWWVNGATNEVYAFING